MKAVVFTLAALFAFSAAQAQTINQGQLPTAGKRQIFTETNSISGMGTLLDVTPGANKTWDFSNWGYAKPGEPDFYGYDTVTFMAPSATPHASGFAGATLAAQLTNGFGGAYQYMRSAADGVYVLGQKTVITDNSTPGISMSTTLTEKTTNGKLLPFPISMGSTANTVVKTNRVSEMVGSMSGIPVFSSKTRNGISSSEQVAGFSTGTVVLPGQATPLNVLCVRRQVIKHDTAYNWTNNQWVLEPSTVDQPNPRIDTSLHFEFYSTADFMVADVTVDRENMMPKDCRFLLNPSVATPLKPVLNRVALRTWPVPAAEFVNVELAQTSQQGDELQIIAADGSMSLQPVAAGQDLARVELAGMAPGIYNFRLVNGTQVQGTGRFIVR